MARKLTLKQARQAAWRGQTDVAISALQLFAEAGNAAASASLAELLAFRGRWEEVIVHAGRLIANPSTVYAGNIFNDMIGLLGRAGHETGFWQRIRDAAATAREDINRNDQRNHARKQFFTILNALEEYSLRSGEAPHELIRVFGVSFDHAQADLDASYRKAVYEATSNNPELRQNPQKLDSYLFAIAKNCNQPNDALKIYDAGVTTFNFNDAVYIAQVLISREASEHGWQILWKHMSQWWPVDKAQVAPVVLLTDPQLRLLISQARSEQILSLPRGSEAETAQQ